MDDVSRLLLRGVNLLLDVETTNKTPLSESWPPRRAAAAAAVAVVGRLVRYKPSSPAGALLADDLECDDNNDDDEDVNEVFWAAENFLSILTTFEKLFLGSKGLALPGPGGGLLTISFSMRPIPLLPLLTIEAELAFIKQWAASGKSLAFISMRVELNLGLLTTLLFTF